MHFLSSLEWKKFRQHMLRCILCPLWDGRGFLNTSSDTYYFLAIMEYDWSIHLEMHLLSSQAWEVLLNTCWGTSYFLAGIEWIWLRHVEMHLVPSLAWDGFGQHELRSILCPRCLGMGLVNKFWDTFCFHAGMGGVRSRQVVMQFLFSLDW